MSDEEFDDLDYQPGGGMPPFIMPLVTAGVAIAVGLVLGAAAVWALMPPEKVEVEVPRDLTTEELAEACAPLLDEKGEEIEELQDRYVKASQDVKSKEAKVAELEAEMKKRAQRGAALVAELEAAKKELEEAKAQLVQVIEERDQLVEELQETIVQLEKTEEELVEQKKETHLAKEDALTNKWFRFVNDAQLEICERGNRKKLGKCRETVTDYMGDEIQRKFAHCVRSGQAVPSVAELEKNETLPEFAAYINQEDRMVKDWYIDFCDPTLPEADMPHEEHLPSSSGGNVSQGPSEEG